MAVFPAVRFIASAHDLRDLPPDTGSEVAFAGRSNAGKSSAINALTQRKRLAFVSKTPGRTQTINFFDCGTNRRLVDLPGYGYAAVSQTERAHWGELVSAYIEGRKSLKGLVIIADSRHELTPSDLQLLGWFARTGQPLLVLLTQSDKLGNQRATLALQGAHNLLARRYPFAAVQLFSAVSGFGVRAAQSVVRDWLE